MEKDKSGKGRRGADALHEEEEGGSDVIEPCAKFSD